MDGTIYTEKQDLIDAVKGFVFTNDGFAVTADGIQTAILDTVESLWNKSQTASVVNNYTTFISLKISAGLTSGQFYQVPYSCVHRIPGTTVLNTSSAQYVAAPETFIVHATSANTISPWVISKENPEDIILWDISQNIAEDGSTARSGKVLFRHNKTKNITTFYDFRGVLFRRGIPDTTTLTPWSTGFTGVRNSITYSGSSIKRATKALSGNTTFSYPFWIETCPTSTSIKWVWKNTVDYVASLNRTSTEDFTTFDLNDVDLSNIYIGPTEENDGYNNIVLRNCSNIYLGDNSYDSHLYFCSDIRIESYIAKSMLGVVTRLRGKLIDRTFIWSASTIECINLTLSIIWGTTGIDLGHDSSLVNMQYCRDNTAGAAFTDNTLMNVIGCTFGNEVQDNYFANFQDTDVKNYVQNNTMVGVTYSNIHNNVSNCTFDATIDQYAVYEHVTIEDNCQGLVTQTPGDVTRVSFGKGCANMIFNGVVSDVNFGAGCSGFTTASTTNLEKTNFGPGCTNFTLAGNSYVFTSDIGPDCDDISLTNSFMEEVKIGPSFNNLTLTASSNIKRTLIGSGCASFTLSGASVIDSCWIGETVMGLVFTAGQLTSVDIKHRAAGLTFTGTLENFVIEQGVQNKTFSPTLITTFKNGSIPSEDTATITYGNGASLQETPSPKDRYIKALSVVANVATANLATEPGTNFSVENNAATSIALTILSC
jgi:hypothetical protein